jgi:hypothetical protein
MHTQCADSSPLPSQIHEPRTHARTHTRTRTRTHAHTHTHTHTNTNTGARTDTAPLFAHVFELADVHTLERTDDSVTMDNEESQSFGYRRSTQFMDTFSQLV